MEQVGEQVAFEQRIAQSLGESVSFCMPEVVLAVAALALLMLGVFRGNKATRLVTWIAVLVFVVVGFMVAQQPAGRSLAFGGTFVVDEFARFLKVLVLIGSGVSMIMSLDYLRNQQLERFEFPVLMVLSVLGMFMMISANNLISLYVGLELQSLALYVLAAFNRDSLRSTEAGLKYFVLGALSSGLLLYGCSLIYGFTGTADFDALHSSLHQHDLSIGILFGLVFVAAGLAFKISAVPFHMWTPDVYEGAPTPVTAFFAAAPKIAAMGLFVRLLMVPFSGEAPAPEWRQIIILVAALSMVVGAFGAIGQTNIKRLMAYSSIAHMGYALVGLSAGTNNGVYSVLLYMLIYMVTTLGAFACILSMRRQGRMIEDMTELAGISRSQPLLAGGFMLLMFSMAGIPPLAGFFAKLFVFWAAIESGLIWLAVLGAVASVVGAFYYIRLVKIMYFDEAVEPFEPMGNEMRLVLLGSVAFTLPLYMLFAFPLRNLMEAAASSLFF